MAPAGASVLLAGWVGVRVVSRMELFRSVGVSRLNKFLGDEVAAGVERFRFGALTRGLLDAFGDQWLLIHQDVHVARIEYEQAGAGHGAHCRGAACLAQHRDLAEEVAAPRRTQRSGRSISTSPAATKYMDC